MHKFVLAAIAALFVCASVVNAQGCNCTVTNTYLITDSGGKCNEDVDCFKGSIDRDGARDHGVCPTHPCSNTRKCDYSTFEINIIASNCSSDCMDPECGTTATVQFKPEGGERGAPGGAGSGSTGPSTLAQGTNRDWTVGPGIISADCGTSVGVHSLRIVDCLGNVEWEAIFRFGCANCGASLGD